MPYYLETRSDYQAAPCSPGLGCIECGGSCGMGFFDSGLDWNGWGYLEWGALIVGAYAVGSMIFTGKRGVREVKQYAGRRRRARAIRERLSE